MKGMLWELAPCDWCVNDFTVGKLVFEIMQKVEIEYKEKLSA